MEVQIFSDLHLEFHKTYPQIRKYADTLILAGDIGCINKTCFKKFIHYISRTWNQIYYVLGNHEYYHSKKTYHNLKTLYKQFFSGFKNITLLDKSYEIVGNTCFIGCTLWGYFCKDNKDFNLSCLNNIKIKTINSQGDARTTGISKEFFNSLYDDESEWLVETINNMSQCKDIHKIIVITHYPLTTKGTSHPKYNGKNTLYATDIDIPSGDTNIICISGHTHYSYDFYDKSGVHHLSNQLGYKDEYLTNETRFNNEGIFTI